jgi:hypothetical protein
VIISARWSGRHAYGENVSQEETCGRGLWRKIVLVINLEEERRRAKVKDGQLKKHAWRSGLFEDWVEKWQGTDRHGYNDKGVDLEGGPDPSGVDRSMDGFGGSLSCSQ